MEIFQLDTKKPERREDEFLAATKCRPILITGNAGCGKSNLVSVVWHNPIKRDHDTALAFRLLAEFSTKELERRENEFLAATKCRPIFITGNPGYGKSIPTGIVWRNPIKRDHDTALAFRRLAEFLTMGPIRRRGGNFFASTWSVYPEDMPSNSLQAKQKLISGVYRSDRGNNSIQVLKMEYSALQGPNSQWNLEVKCKVRENKTSAKRWVNIWTIYPDAKVDLKRNEIELTISSPNEDHEFAVFGTPRTEDKKRMQMGIYGGKPKQGKHWQIFVTLFDDTMMAFKRVCEREESKGRQLLTALAGLFVSNSDEDIEIYITGLEEGWEIIGSHFMTIKSKEAWNSPENSTDFPCCVFEIAHVDKTKQTFFCGMQTSHLNDTAETELVAFFEQEEENEERLNSQNFIPPPELTITEDNFIDPSLAINESVPYGDLLLGYIRNSLGLNDTYFKEPGVEPKTSLTSLQLNKIIHSDLIAAGFFLVEEKETCKVTDFGMARDVNQGNINERKTESELPVKWIACEELEFGRYTANCETHRWSLGILLYVILTKEVSVKAGTPSVYELDKLADAIRNGWKSLVRLLAWEPLVRGNRYKKPKISFTDGENGVLYDVLLHWKQEQTEAFVSVLIVVFIIGCLTGTGFVTPHLLKVEDTEGRALPN